MSATKLEAEAPRIALALAAGLVSFDEVPSQFELADEEWEAFRFTPFFKQLYAATKEEWSGEINAPKRIRLKSLAMLESALPVLHDLAVGQEIHPSNKLDAIRQMEKLAGAGTETDTQVGPGFRLEINIGTENGVQTLTLDGGDMKSAGVIPGYDEELKRPLIPYDDTENWELQAGVQDVQTDD